MKALKMSKESELELRSETHWFYSVFCLWAADGGNKFFHQIIEAETFEKQQIYSKGEHLYEFNIDYTIVRKYFWWKGLSVQIVASTFWIIRQWKTFQNSIDQIVQIKAKTILKIRQLNIHFWKAIMGRLLDTRPNSLQPRWKLNKRIHLVSGWPVFPFREVKK